MDSRRTYHVLTLLRLLQSEELHSFQAASKLGVSLRTAQRYLRDLRVAGFAERNPETERWFFYDRYH